MVLYEFVRVELGLQAKMCLKSLNQSWLTDLPYILYIHACSKYLTTWIGQHPCDNGMGGGGLFVHHEAKKDPST